MDYMTVKEASEIWNIDVSTIGKLLRAGRIPEATKIGGHWIIPRSTPKVPDGRTKAAKARLENTDNKDYFRFPLYVNGEKSDFVPSLSENEKKLRQAELDFLACDFQEAEEKLNGLSENTENIYLRIMSLFWLCLLSAVNNNANHFGGYFINLEQALGEEFQNKREMELLRPWLYAAFAQYRKTTECFDFDMNYNYSPSVLPLMTYLLLVADSCVEQPTTFDKHADYYEIAVRQLTSSGNILEAQILHLALFVIYFVASDEERMNFHLKNAVEIAYKYNFIYFVADAYPYYISTFESILSDYPQEFADKIMQYGMHIHKSFSAFLNKLKINDIFYLLSNNDIKFVLYAVQGYSYKEVAKILHVSERTVSNRYGKIYNKLGIAGKQELLNMTKDI